MVAWTNIFARTYQHFRYEHTLENMFGIEFGDFCKYQLSEQQPILHKVNWRLNQSHHYWHSYRYLDIIVDF
jgi:hypothetical protein